MAVTMHQGNLPHIYWVDLKNDGVYTECAVMKTDGLGNVYYFPLNALDDIDKRRLARILANRNADHFELWDLMSNITLNNGVNALTYFHQLVQVITPGGRTMRPQEGVVGAGVEGVLDTRGKDARKMMDEAASSAARAAAGAAAEAAVNAIHNAGRAQAAAQAAPPAPAKKSRAPKKSSGDTGTAE